MALITPPYLKPGDSVMLLAPAGRLADCDAIDLAVAELEKQNFKAVVHPQACRRFGSLAGTDEERAQALMDALSDPGIKAVWSVRGGYGSIRIIDQIPPAFIKQNPKWLIGFSDITTLHYHWNKAGLVSLHGLMPVNLKTGYTPASLDLLFDFLTGQKPVIQIKRDSANLHEKNLSGQLTGGNLATLYALAVNKDFDFRNKIVFLEDVGEYLYALDRMFQAFKHAGLWEQAKAIVIGQFSGIKQDDPPFPCSVKQIVTDSVKDAGIPVFFGFPAGHTEENLPLLLGNHYEIKVTKKDWKFIPV